MIERRFLHLIKFSLSPVKYLKLTQIFRYKNTYRNRYTHFVNAYPRNLVGIRIFVTGLGVVLGIAYFGSQSYLPIDDTEDIEQIKAGVLKVDCESSVDSENEKESVAAKNKKSFRERKFIAYEDRIRAFSTPDKIFRYFATLKCVEDDGTSEIYMTPDDFLRAITPGVKQPEGLTLDSFNRFDPKKDKLNLSIKTDSIFYCLGTQALITFTDFVFLLTVISTPRRQFEIAFRMFDLNGDGQLDSNEFDVVRSVILDTTAMGRRHRDHSTTGSTLKSVSHSYLSQYFFGKNRQEKLTISKFLDFQARLQEEITNLEFNRLEPDENGLISARAFAKSLLTYAGFSENKRRLMLRRVIQKFGNEFEGISFQQFLDFSRLLRSISELDTALTFHTLAGAAINKQTFIHMTKVVANVELKNHVVDVVFTLFDENDDGELSYKEFVSVMKNRLLRGLDKPMDTGLVRFLSALLYCTKHEIKQQLE